MVQEIEMESKNLLTEMEYNTLLDFFELRKEDAHSQTNHYFETPDFQLKNKGAALRIRKKKDKWQLTLKEPYQDGLLETHDNLTEQEANSWINNKLIAKPAVKQQLDGLGIDFQALSYGGSLTTHRTELPYKQALLVIDYSIYNNMFDYELEIESDTKEKSEKLLHQLINQFHITKKPTPNKIERFYHSLENR
ncbi:MULTISPECIES: CYTH domain-containing protein [Paraliobacillus]|uniref:CYTH domain-containing protein n=1 Tax=Paraliobacillus TaxID=200903 RepID=UPI000DD43F99|nr:MULTISPECIES: CYTH domain-containing protein [Paraliobacillus]